MEEEKSDQESNSGQEFNSDTDSNVSHVKSHKSKEVSDNALSTESILSTINNECNKISSGEKENGMEIDSEQSQDVADRENCTNDSSKEETERSCSQEQIPENGQSSIESSEHTSSPTQLQCANTNNGTADNSDLAAEPTENDDNETDTLEQDATELSESPQHENTESKDSKEVESLDSTEGKDSKETSELEVKDLEMSEMETDKPDEVNMDENESNFSNLEGSESLQQKDSEENSTDSNKEKSETSHTGKLPVKIKLRSFASLCENDSATDQPHEPPNTFNLDPGSNLEVSGLAVGDIVQHSNIVESDESGVMHLRISNVVGGEDCITGLSMDEGSESSFPIQISSVTSLIEPLSPDDNRIEKMSVSNSTEDGTSGIEIAGVESMANKMHEMDNDVSKNKDIMMLNSHGPESHMGTIVNIYRSPLVVLNLCYHCKQKVVCDFRMVWREKSGNKVFFLCSLKCKNSVISSLPENTVVQKPRLYFERVCGMCGKDTSTLPKSDVLTWQTREFCNKLCLADHIGEVARVCYYCKSNVRVLYMVKYCVRFGSDVHQFCCNTCLETYKSTIKVCSFCQKNLTYINKVISPSNKEYCSNKCLKRAQRRDIGQINYKEENDCTVCAKKMINKFEFINNGASTFLCSNPCLNVFKYVNKVKSVNCCLCARLLNAEDTCNYFFNGMQLRVFCSESCFSVFVISSRKIVTCQYCKVKKYNFDMICTSLGEDSGDMFCCSVCCLKFIQNQKQRSPLKEITLSTTAVGTDDSSVAGSDAAAVVDTQNSQDAPPSSSPCTPILKNCSLCSKLEPAQFHMVMSDSTLRSFCSYICASRYKCTFGFQVSGGLHSQVQKEGVLNAAKPPLPGKENATVGTDSPPSMKGVPVSAATPKTGTKMDLKDAKTLVRLFCPPHLSNKSISCRPILSTKGIQCKPHQWHKSSQTDEEAKVIIPVPIPVYVPTPMMMYSAPTPVPLVIPVPVPIPVFIPTAEKTTKELEDKIKSILEEFPSNPEEAEMIYLSKEEELKNKKRKLGDDDDVVAKEEDVCESEWDILSKIEASLPKYNLQTGESPDAEGKGSENKRKTDEETAVSAKRRKLDNQQVAEEIEDEDSLDLLLGLSVWHAWVQKKRAEGLPSSDALQEDLSQMSSEELSQGLILFLEELSVQALYYESDTVFYILLGLQKFLFEKGSTHCIFLEVNFDCFTSAFDEIVQKFFQFASSPEDSKCLPGTRVTEEMMWEARQLGAHTPHVLINTLFYFNTKIFRLKSPEDHVSLTLNQVTKEMKPSGTAANGSTALTCLKYSQGSEPDGEAEKRASPLLMFENKANPLRCPVKLYEFYLSKCPKIRTQKDGYYVYPEKTCLPDSPVWYSSISLEMRTIEKMLHRILLVREVQESLFESEM